MNTFWEEVAKLEKKSKAAEKRQDARDNAEEKQRKAIINKAKKKQVADKKKKEELEAVRSDEEIGDEQEEKNSTIFAIIDGNVVDKHKRRVLSYGDIIRTGTLKKLSEVFKIRKYLTVIRVWK